MRTHHHNISTNCTGRQKFLGIISRHGKLTIPEDEKANFSLCAVLGVGTVDVGDVITSLLATCELNGINGFDYLLALQQHRQAMERAPERWLPWNYLDALAALKVDAIAVSEGGSRRPHHRMILPS